MTEIISKLQAEVAQLRRENKEWKQKYDDVVTKVAKATPNLTKKYNPLLDNMTQLLNTQPDYVKSLVSEGKIGMDDVDSNGSTLLMWTCSKGDYDITQLCINLGADIDAKNDVDMTALDFAQGISAYHCEQLLLFRKLNANVSDNVQNIAFNMNKQNSIVENILNEMNNIIKDKNEQNKFLDTLTKIMCNIIGKRLSFSDDLLNLCWMYNKNTDSNDLWNVLIETCNDIIENGSKKEWYYFKTFILTSNVCNILYVSLYVFFLFFVFFFCFS